MTHNWDSSKRRPDPPYWPALRRQIIARAKGLCEHSDGCTYTGQDVDHILNLAKGGTDASDNLQLLCAWHHKRKTSKEASEARGPRESIYRKKEAHPGLIDPRGGTLYPLLEPGGEVL
jgi:5-methylcytosine-specific restriction endonuclease McrA